MITDKNLSNTLNMEVLSLNYKINLITYYLVKNIICFLMY